MKKIILITFALVFSTLGFSQTYNSRRLTYYPDLYAKTQENRVCNINLVLNEGAKTFYIINVENNDTLDIVKDLIKSPVVVENEGVKTSGYHGICSHGAKISIGFSVQILDGKVLGIGFYDKTSLYTFIIFNPPSL